MKEPTGKEEPDFDPVIIEDFDLTRVLDAGRSHCSASSIVISQENELA